MTLLHKKTTTKIKYVLHKTSGSMAKHFKFIFLVSLWKVNIVKRRMNLILHSVCQKVWNEKILLEWKYYFSPTTPSRIVITSGITNFNKNFMMFSRCLAHCCCFSHFFRLMSLELTILVCVLKNIRFQKFVEWSGYVDFFFCAGDERLSIHILMLFTCFFVKNMFQSLSSKQME